MTSVNDDGGCSHQSCFRCKDEGLIWSDVSGMWQRPLTGNEMLPLSDQVTTAYREARTDDEGKAPLAWVPWAAIQALSRVQAYGHKKYQDFNNYRKGMRVSRNLSCALRHIAAYMEGTDVDPESKESHLAHAFARIAFVLQNLADGKAIDDRYKEETK